MKLFTVLLLLLGVNSFHSPSPSLRRPRWIQQPERQPSTRLFNSRENNGDGIAAAPPDAAASPTLAYALDALLREVQLLKDGDSVASSSNSSSSSSSRDGSRSTLVRRRLHPRLEERLAEEEDGSSALGAAPLGSLRLEVPGVVLGQGGRGEEEVAAVAHP